jgi:hypothetical protein
MPSPAKYKKEYCELLTDLFSKGDSVCHFCVAAGIGRQTFYDWLEAHEEFAQAYTLAKEMAEMHLTDLGKAGAHGEIDGFNVTAWSILMRNKCNYTEHRKVKLDFSSCKSAQEKYAVLDEAISAGSLTPAEARSYSDYIANAIKVEENTELKRRLEALEDGC